MAPPQLNTLAVVVLDLLHERPMHPYEMTRILAERHVDEILGVKRGSLYGTVERLERDGLVEAVETSREGRRPERTVYRVTDAGRDAHEARTHELITGMPYEPRRFTAGMMLINTLAPEQAARLLADRLVSLRAQIAAFDVVLAEHAHLPRVYMLEVEFAQTLLRAEQAWVEGVRDDLEAGRLDWSPSGEGSLRLTHDPQERT